MANFPGTPGDDTIVGLSSDDTIDGLAGNDLLKGGLGYDTMTGGDGNDRLHGGDADDWLTGGDGNDLLAGDTGRDHLEGGVGNDKLYGGAGIDVLVGGAGSDKLYGGAGADSFVYTSLTDSTTGSFDVIFDFEHGIDKIDLSAFSYTSLTTGTPGADQLRMVYSAATDRTYLLNDADNFRIALAGDYRDTLTINDIRLSHPDVHVGYYMSEYGSGNHEARLEAPINRLGYTPVSLETLANSELRDMDAVVIFNQSETGYGNELLNAGSRLANYVFNGGVLIIHDNFVDTAEQLLPGLIGENIVRSRLSPTDINFVNDTGAIAHGTGAFIDDSSLDSPYSLPGFAFDSSLNSDVVRVQTSADGSQVLSFAYAYGAGAVYFSSIPLEGYLSSFGDTDLGQAMQAYAANVISWAVNGHDLLSL